MDGSYSWRPWSRPTGGPTSTATGAGRPRGLTWVSYEPWGWLPYHYGPGTGTPASAGTGVGASYSPAWVYWSYTPRGSAGARSGTTAGTTAAIRRSPGSHPGRTPSPTGTGRAPERGTHAYPHLRGHVEVTRVDPRGWSYTSIRRIGSRFDSRRDVLGQERVGFRAGERGFVATSRFASIAEAGRLGDDRRPGRRPQGSSDHGRRDPRRTWHRRYHPVLRRDGTLGHRRRSRSAARS